MKKILVFVLSILAISACDSVKETTQATEKPAVTQKARFKAGTHYEVLPVDAAEKPVVEEFFSFYCGHCAQFLPIVNQLKAQLPTGIELKKHHVGFIGKHMGKELQLAFAASQLLNVEDKVEQSLFDLIHNQKRPVRSRSDIIAVFKQHGISEQDYEAAITNFMVTGMADNMSQQSKKYKINAVPALIINGKYKVNRSSVKSMAEFNALVNYLVSQK